MPAAGGPIGPRTGRSMCATVAPSAEGVLDGEDAQPESAGRGAAQREPPRAAAGGGGRAGGGSPAAGRGGRRSRRARRARRGPVSAAALADRLGAPDPDLL